ncbi:MAG: hypothetical protein HKM95_10785, partial [Inquilinus sp.]|nr:hypothetical protein [Inquilinus sp.]
MLAAVALHAGEAAAQTLSSALLVGSGALGLILGAAAIFGFVTLRRQARRQAARAEHFERETARLEAFLDASPESCCGWDAAGALAVSDGFVRLLGAGTVRTLEDIELSLVKQDAKELRRVFLRLRNDGEPFNITVRTASALPDGKTRLLWLSGRRGRAYHGESHFDV